MSRGAERPAAILANFGFDLHPRAVDALCARVYVTRDRRQRERRAAKPEQLDSFARNLEQLVDHRHGSSPNELSALPVLIELSTRTPAGTAWAASPAQRLVRWLQEPVDWIGNWRPSRWARIECLLRALLGPGLP